MHKTYKTRPLRVLQIYEYENDEFVMTISLWVKILCYFYQNSYNWKLKFTLNIYFDLLSAFTKKLHKRKFLCKPIL